MLDKRREDPLKWTVERMGAAFKVNPGSLETFLKHYNSVLIANDQKGRLAGYWDLPKDAKSVAAPAAPAPAAPAARTGAAPSSSSSPSQGAPFNS